METLSTVPGIVQPRLATNVTYVTRVCHAPRGLACEGDAFHEMEPRRGHQSLPAFEQAAFNEWLGSRNTSRGTLPGHQLHGLNLSSVPGLTGQASEGPMGSGYLGLDPVLPSVGLGASLAYQPYTPFDNSATERQLADLFPNHLDMLNVPGLPQIDPYHAVFQEDPLFGPSVEEGQEGEEKPRSKMQEKNRRVRIRRCTIRMPTMLKCYIEAF